MAITSLALVHSPVVTVDSKFFLHASRRPMIPEGSYEDSSLPQTLVGPAAAPKGWCAKSSPGRSRQPRQAQPSPLSDKSSQGLGVDLVCTAWRSLIANFEAPPLLRLITLSHCLNVGHWTKYVQHHRTSPDKAKKMLLFPILVHLHSAGRSRGVVRTCSLQN